MDITQVQSVLQSPHGRSFSADVSFVNDGRAKPVAIFSHGFKGFKDWGPYNQVAAQFAAAGIVFVKFNFSHNGTTPQHPTEFVDLEAFSNDNFSIELDDLGTVIDWVLSPNFPAHQQINPRALTLIGHSRGGGISILKAREDTRVARLCTWASVNEFSKYWSPEQLQQIKTEGQILFPNTRTGQQMAVKWQMYENYFANLHRLFIPDAVRQLQIPFLIIHGTHDETVPYTAALDMHKWNPLNELFLIEHANHNFGAKHPYTSTVLPEHLLDAITETISFIKRN